MGAIKGYYRKIIRVKYTYVTAKKVFIDDHDYYYYVFCDITEAKQQEDEKSKLQKGLFITQKYASLEAVR